MYCPTCANPVKKGLKYCNSCGGRLKKDEPKGGPAEMLDGILETIFWTLVLSLGGLVGLVAVMLNKSMDPMIVGMVAAGYLLVVFGICFMLARQIPKLIDAKLKSLAGVTDDREAPQLATQRTAQLEEFREPVMSVTDRTTKTLDKVPVSKG